MTLLLVLVIIFLAIIIGGIIAVKLIDKRLDETVRKKYDRPIVWDWEEWRNTK